MRTLLRFLALYALMYAAFGVSSPFMPALFERRGLGPEQLGMLFAAGTGIRLVSGPLCGRLADHMQALRAVLTVCTTLAALIAIGLLSAVGFPAPWRPTWCHGESTRSPSGGLGLSGGGAGGKGALELLSAPSDIGAVYFIPAVRLQSLSVANSGFLPRIRSVARAAQPSPQLPAQWPSSHIMCKVTRGSRHSNAIMPGTSYYLQLSDSGVVCMRTTRQRQGRVHFKRWFQIHVWCAFASLLILLMLALTGMLIYPLDQLGLRDIPLRSPWLPPRYEVNAWGPLLRSLAVSPEGWLYATHKYGIFVSRDGGQHWQDLTERIPGRLEPPPGLFPPILALYPFDPRIIVASKGRGLARSDDGGKSWEPFGDSDDADLSHSGIQHILYGSPGVVLVIDEQGLVYRRWLAPSADEGWERLSVGLPYGEQRQVGVLDWSTVALFLHNGQLLSARHWWMINHSFGLVVLLLALTGLVVWCRRNLARPAALKSPRLVPSKVFRMLHHVGGLLSWPLFVLFPLTGVVLLHTVDFPALLHHGLPTRWLPPQFDQNRWQGPVHLHLRTMAVSPANAARLWLGHTYGLFASEDAGQHWTNVGAGLQTPVVKQVEHLLVGPWWFDFLYVGNARGLQVSRDYGRHWQLLLDRPVDALYASRDTLYVASGNHLLRQKFHSLVALALSPWEQTALAPPYGLQHAKRQTTLYQLLHDLHSGKLLGSWCKYLFDLVAGLMLLQNLTGLFLWGKPRWQRWRRSRVLACCIGLAVVPGMPAAYAADTTLPPAAFTPFMEAKQTGDLQQLLAVLQRVGQADTEDAATAILYAGLSDRILAGLSEAHTQQVLTTAQAVLLQMTEKQAWKSIYRATSRHPDWRVRSMLLDVVKTRVSTDERAQKALVTSLTDSTDGVAFKAIDLVGDLRLKQAVPALMRLVMAKWGQQVGIGAAKATLALEKITGTAEPAGWQEWVNKNP